MRGAKPSAKKSSINPSGVGGGHGGGGDFGSSNIKPAEKKGGAGGAAGGSTTSRFNIISIFMWLLNCALVAASYFALSNWTAINWMTGSYGWAALLEIGALLLLLYQFIVGTCLMGWSDRIERSFIHLDDSPQLLYLFALAIPFMIVSFFGALTILSLVNMSATNLFVGAYSEEVFKQACAYAGGSCESIDRWTFMKYICSLDSFWPQCGTKPNDFFTRTSIQNGLTPWEMRLRQTPVGWENKAATDYPFYIRLSEIFDSMTGGTFALTRNMIYQGVISALAPYKKQFGWATLAVTSICLLQFGYYWLKWSIYQKTNKKLKEAEKEQLPFIGP